MILLMPDLLIVTLGMALMGMGLGSMEGYYLTLIREGVAEETWESTDKYICCVCTKQISGNFTMEKLVYAWVNIIEEQQTLQRLIHYKFITFFFSFPEDFRRGIDRRSNWQNLLWLSEGMQKES